MTNLILTVKTDGDDQWDKVFTLHKNLTKQFLLRSGSYVKNVAQQSLHEGNKTGDSVRKYRPKRIHKQSAPGEPPATDTNTLAKGISVEIHADGQGVSISSNANYSTALEFGTKNMLPRPFLMPALEASIPEIRRLFFKTFKDGANKRNRT